MDIVLTLSIFDIIAAITTLIAGFWALFKYVIAPPITELSQSVKTLSSHLSSVELDVAKNYVTKKECRYTHNQIKEI